MAVMTHLLLEDLVTGAGRGGVLQARVVRAHKGAREQQQVRAQAWDQGGVSRARAWLLTCGRTTGTGSCPRLGHLHDPL